jgi:hypothetical protein
LSSAVITFRRHPVKLFCDIFFCFGFKKSIILSNCLSILSLICDILSEVSFPRIALTSL